MTSLLLEQEHAIHRADAMGRYLSEKGPWTHLGSTLLTTPEAPKAGGELSLEAPISPPRDFQPHIDSMAASAQLELDISSLDLTGVIGQRPDQSELETQQNLTQTSSRAPPVNESQDVRIGELSAAGARLQGNAFVEFELELGMGGWNKVGMWSRSNMFS